MKIIGTGFEFERLSQKYNDNSIKFIGSISNENALKEIKNSRAVVTATKLYEGQPRVLLEASSFGVPSIFPNFGGMPEFFPSDYKLSFEQFNYEQLNENISKLNNKDLLIEESLKLSKFISKKFNDKVNYEKFTSILNELDKMNKKPLVSIIMSVYNEEERVEKCINSILNQDYKNFEFLIVDDFSEDNTLEVLNKFSREDSRIKIFKNKSNLGLTKNLNFLIKKSSGDFVARQDADDTSKQDRIKNKSTHFKV